MKQFKIPMLAAFYETKKKYLNPYGKYFFSSDECAICRLVYDKIQKEMPRGWLSKTNHCHFCPMCPNDLHFSAGSGCTMQRTYQGAEELYLGDADVLFYPFAEKDPPPEFIARAESLQRMIDIIKSMPLERFHVDTWTPFGFPEDI